MSIVTECANENDAVLTQIDPGAKLRKRIFIGFVGTMALGLSLTGWYVGGRIFASEQVPPVSEAKAAVIQPVESPAAPIDTPAVPPARQLFLEVAGLNATQDLQYIQKLRAKGL